MFHSLGCEDCDVTKTTQEAVEWLIDTVKEALEDGRASESDLQDWLLAAIALEDLALEDEIEAREARTFATLTMLPTDTLH